MENEQIPWIVKACAECIEPKNFEDGSTRYVVENSREIYNAFIANDPNGFQSDLCVGCEDGLVPSHLPLEQVIRFIKNIFEKHNIQI